MKKDMETLQAKFDSAEADNKKLKEDADKREAEYKARFDADVKERIEMLDFAKSHGIEKADEMTAKDIKIAVVKSVRGDSFNLDGKSDEYINACFDLCKDRQAVNADDGLGKQRQSMGKPADRQDKSDDDMSVEELEQKLQQDEANLYLAPQGFKQK